jgi:signal transduction histidine kinase
MGQRLRRTLDTDTVSAFHTMWRIRPLFVRAGATLLLLATAVCAEAEPRRVLLLYSYEREFSHFTFARLFRPELARSSPDPIDFIEVSLQSVRDSRSESDAAILDRLHGTPGGRPLDLVVPIGGPAAAWAQKRRADLFPQAPILYAAVDSRFVESGALTATETAVMVKHDPPQIIESILRLRPETRTVLVVIGASKLEQFWLDVVKRAFQRFEHRVTFIWTNQLSLAELLKRAGSLPPHSAIFYGILSMDATGAPQMEEPVLDALHAAANAPMFGLHSHQLGRGIVGGPLVSLPDLSRDTTAVALRLLAGESPARIEARTLVAGTPTFDARELRRWGIPERRLQAGSVVRFHEPAAWRRQGAFAVVGVVAVTQIVAVIALAVTLRRRRADAAPRADAWDVSSAEAALARLTHRLIQAHEEERASLANAIDDDVCQQLTGLTLRLHLLGNAPDGPSSEQRARIHELCAQFSALQREILSISDPLYARLRLLGLVESARSFCERRCAEHGLSLEFHGETRSRVPDDVAVVIVRVLQESLANVIAHARATHVTVALRETNGGIDLEVADDGNGFDPEAAIRGTAVGLVAIRERLRNAGGTCAFDSRPGAGTRIRARVPLQRPR